MFVLPGRRVRLVSVILAALGFVLLALLASSCGGGTARIGVFQYGEDPDTSAAYRGFLRGMEENGYVEGENLEVVFEDCRGDEEIIAWTAEDFAASELDLIVPLTTPCLTAAAEYIEDKPVVFTSVYDPVTAGVAVAPDNHPGNITGVYSPPPVEETLVLIEECRPDLQSMGTIYNPEEPNSVSAVQKMESWCRENFIMFFKVEVGDPKQVEQAARWLVEDGAGAIYVTGDNTTMSAFDVLAGVACDSGIPIFSNDPGFAEYGAAVALGPDFETAGIEGGKVAAEVLEGKDPSGIDMLECRETLLYVNKTAAAAQGLEIPPSVIDKADEIID